LEIKIRIKDKAQSYFIKPDTLTKIRAGINQKPGRTAGSAGYDVHLQLAISVFHCSCIIFLLGVYWGSYVCFFAIWYCL